MSEQHESPESILSKVTQVKETDSYKVNDYLRAGWTLIKTFIIKHEDGETVNYVLAWRLPGKQARPSKKTKRPSSTEA